MSFIVIDTLCPHCGEEEERFLARDTLDHIMCGFCGRDTKRKPSAPKVDWDSLAMGNDASPEAIRHWERKHRQIKEKETKEIKEHGSRTSTPGS